MTTEQQRAVLSGMQTFDDWKQKEENSRQWAFSQTEIGMLHLGWVAAKQAALAALPQGEPFAYAYDDERKAPVFRPAAHRITGDIGHFTETALYTAPPSLAEAVERENELQTILQDVFAFAGRLRNISKLHSDQLADYCQRKGYKPNFIRASAPGGQE